jgi:hypothetical protein
MCNKTSKTIEYYKIFLCWIIKRAHGIPHEPAFGSIARLVVVPRDSDYTHLCNTYRCGASLLVSKFNAFAYRGDQLSVVLAFSLTLSIAHICFFSHICVGIATNTDGITLILDTFDPSPRLALLPHLRLPIFEQVEECQRYVCPL